MSSPEMPFKTEQKEQKPTHPRETLQKWEESHEAIRRADPLGADEIFEVRFPQLNEDRDTNGWVRNIDGLVTVAESIIPSRDAIRSYSLIDARAAKRDLGFISASLSQPDGKMRFVEGLEPAMIDLAAKTGDVPAQTIFDYTSYNPQEERIRAFTTSYHERTVITETSKGTRALADCITKLDEANDLDIFHPQYAYLVEEAAADYTPMSESIFNVRRKLPDRFFGQVIQKNFREVTIGGKKYNGAGGGQIPVYLIDRILGTLSTEVVEERDATEQFRKENLKYSPPEIRNFASSIANKNTLLEGAERTVNSGVEGNLSIARESINALMRMREEVNIFRIRHEMLAKRDLEGREEKIGTGGHDIEMLKLLGKLTKQAGYLLDKTSETLWRSE